MSPILLSLCCSLSAPSCIVSRSRFCSDSTICPQTHRCISFADNWKCSAFIYNGARFRRRDSSLRRTITRKRLVVCMAPEEEKTTRLSHLDFPIVSDEVHVEESIGEGEKRFSNDQDSAQKLNGEQSESRTSDEEHLKSSKNSTEELHKQMEKVKESLTEVAKKAVEKEKESLSWAMKSSSVQEQSRKCAKIHDFCFGIPYGGLLAGGGLLGFFITRNTAFLVYGLLLGGSVLGLSITSLKVWKQGKASSPYILGQAALAFILLARQLQVFSLTKNIFPTGLIAIISAAMLGFYSYVYMSGGNPPSKKLKPAPVS